MPVEWVVLEGSNVVAFSSCVRGRSAGLDEEKGRSEEGTHLDEPRDDVRQEIVVEHATPQKLGDGKTRPVPGALFDGADVGPLRPPTARPIPAAVEFGLVGREDIAPEELDDGLYQLAGVRRREERAEPGEIFCR